MNDSTVGASTADLTGRVVVITGAAGDLGRFLARRFDATGAHLVLVDIDEPGLAEIADELDGEHAAIAADLTDPDAPGAIMATTLERFGRVDALVNNAGGHRRTDPLEMTREYWQHVQTLNLTGPFFLAQAVAAQMVAQGGGGSIVNVTSIAGSSALGRGNIAFSVAKAGLNHMTRELAIEWGHHDIRVNAVAPSQIEAEHMSEWLESEAAPGLTHREKFEAVSPRGRLVRATDIVGLIAFLCTDDAAMITGTMIPVDGGNLAANVAGTIVRPAR